MNSLVQEKIKNISLYTKRLRAVNFLGNARCALKGSGLEFDQLRDYQLGDDVRSIDWNSSARMSKILVKEFTDERHRTIILVLDISDSTFFGSGDTNKHDLIANIGAIISYAALLSKDEVGLVLFTDMVECYIQPKRGISHVRVILEKIFSAQPSSKKTDTACVINFIAQLRKKNSMVFFISDFIQDDFDSKKMAALAYAHDVIAIRVLDKNEVDFPIAGLIKVQDTESGEECIIDTRTKKGVLQTFLHNRLVSQKNTFNSCNVKLLDLNQNLDVIDSLTHFFKRARLK